MITNIQQEILNHLKKDDKISLLVENCRLTIHKKPIMVFNDLIRSIVSQQLSTSAAATIYRRFETMMEGPGDITEKILNKSIEELRSVGLSNQKASYIQNCARHFDENKLHATDWSTWSDDEIIAELTKIKGVGKWTVEMILMFSLFREDVFPYDDLVIRNNIIKLYGITAEKKELIPALNAVADQWRPYRSYACRYLWAAKDSEFLK